MKGNQLHTNRTSILRRIARGTVVVASAAIMAASGVAWGTGTATAAGHNFPSGSAAPIRPAPKPYVAPKGTLLPDPRPLVTEDDPNWDCLVWGQWVCQVFPEEVRNDECFRDHLIFVIEGRDSTLCPHGRGTRLGEWTWG